MANQQCSIFVTFQFEGFHCWPNAPEQHAYLRARHRHIFHVRAFAEVTHHDRDIEFIAFKREMEQHVLSIKDDNKVQSWSCEMWASYLSNTFGCYRVEVSEDNENGAIYEISGD